MSEPIAFFVRSELDIRNGAGAGESVEAKGRGQEEKQKKNTGGSWPASATW